jgi:DNA-binding IclR family transcriptional regulator
MAMMEATQGTARLLKSPGNKATARILTVLSAVADHGSSIGVTELSRKLGMTKNMVHRALATLIEHGYLVRDASGQFYELGYGVIQLRGHDTSEPDIRTICRPFLEKVHGLTTESVYLSIIVGRTRINIDAIEARGPRITHVQRGRPLPLHVTVTGRTLLAFLNDIEIDAYISTAQFGDYPDAIVTDGTQVWKHVRAIRDRGYGLSRGESTAGLTTASVFAAFVVVDGQKRPHAALTVGAPAERFSLSQAEKYAPQIVRILEEANRQLHHVPAYSQMAI